MSRFFYLPTLIALMLVILMSGVVFAAGPPLTFVEVQKNGAGSVDGLNDIRNLTVSPDGKNVYTARDGLAVFTRDATSGALTWLEVHRDGVNGVDGIAALLNVTVSPDGKHVYAAGVNENAIAWFSRDAGTGALTWLDDIRETDLAVSGLVGPRWVEVSPDGKHVYVSSGNSNAVTVFSRNAGSGALTWLEKHTDVAPSDRISGTFTLTISPDGKHVYIGAITDDAVTVFSRDAGSGLLTFVEDHFNGFLGADGLNGTLELVVSPDGKHLYVAGQVDNAVAVFSRDAGTGALTFVEVIKDSDLGVDGLGGARSVAVSPNGNWVYVTGASGDELGVFARDSNTGELTFSEVHKDDGIGGSIDGLNGPESLFVSPDGNHLYVAGNIDDSVVVFSGTGTVVGALATTSVAPASLVAGATGNVVVTFTTVTAVNFGKVQVTFPAGFDVSGAGVNASGTNITGTLALDSVAGQVVTITVPAITAAQAGAAFTLTGIKNPTATGGTNVFGIETQSVGGFPIDEDTSVAQVTITHAGASKLAVTTQPSASTVIDLVFAVQPIVTIQDQFGNTVTDSVLVVTASLTTGGGALTGTLTEAASAGVANFAGNGLKIDQVGTDKVLTFTASELTSATSNPAFTITVFVSVPVPGVSTWGLIVLALIMTGAAFVILRRRKMQQA